MVKRNKKNKLNKNNQYQDPYELQDGNNGSYLKEIAGLTALIGGVTAGAAFMPNGRVHAATNSVDSKSGIVGSISTSVAAGSNSKLDQNNASVSTSQKLSQSTSQVISKSASLSLSQSGSLSQSLSQSESALSSLSLAKNHKNSQSLAANEKNVAPVSRNIQSASTTNSTSTSSSLQSQVQTSTSTSEIQASLSSLSNNSLTAGQTNSLAVAMQQGLLTTNLLSVNNNVLANSSTNTDQEGTTQLASDAYQVSGINAGWSAGATSADLGYAYLNFTFKPTTTIKAGDYFDVQLGLPTQNGLKLYGPHLVANTPVYDTGGKTQVGTIYGEGTYYRVVFNENAESITSGNNQPNWTFNLKWGGSYGSQNPWSYNTVYQYTDTAAQNYKTFSYTPNNDLLINGQQYASGLSLPGQYVYDKSLLNGATYTSDQMSQSNVRQWTSDGKVVINSDWTNSVQVKIATANATDPSQNTSTNFDINVTVGNNDLLNYQWVSDSDLAANIKNDLASGVKWNLSNELTDSNGLYTTENRQTEGQIKSDVTVTHTDTTLADGRIQRTYHVVLSNPDAQLSGGYYTVLTVRASDFTIPSDVTSYQQDNDDSIVQGNYGYANQPSRSANTSNQVLLNALINTAAPVVSVQNNTTHQTAFTSTPGSLNWGATISQIDGSNISNSVDPSNTRTATLEFVNDNDPAHPITVPGVTNAVTGAANTKIDFNQATNTLAELEKQGYSLEKVVNDQTGEVITPGDGVSPTDLSAYNYGNLVNSANKFTVYLKFTDLASISTSQSMSTSAITSNSISESQAVSTSQSISQSIAESESASDSVSNSESLYNSISSSDSLSNSVSMSESLSNSVSMSESLSNSVSMSESLSNSVSMSESLSNSVSMSESLSNSVSMSESLSNSVSMSESLSNSVSMSESLSNSVSMSESLSNSVSMSESLSNSVSMSESLSNSVSMSESLSNSVSMSESLSNSVSMSESLSNSVSMSESLSNSVSMSESLSNSVSMSESLSNSVSMSESLSNSVSMSESLSNSVSMSESLSNSVSMSESLSNSVSMSESLSNSVSMSESLSNSVSMSESLSNSVSMSESL
ncbi:MAG: cell wall anchor protein, partial [Lactobacillus sp.]|nr:cell wall anchor protein [Lactobacillus sp.]